MDSDHEIPASQLTATPAKPANDRRRGKRKKLSLGSGKRKPTSTVHRSESDEPSTSHAVNASSLAGEANSKINIYLYDDDNLEPRYSQSIIPKDYDIYESAKILERANVPASQDEVRAIRAAQKKINAPRELISVRRLMEIERNASAGVSAFGSNYQLETQMPGVSETQFTSVCHLLDEAHLLIGNEFQFSEWPCGEEQSVDSFSKTGNKVPEIAQAILDDFEIESEDDSVSNTPPRLILMKPSRKYTRNARKNFVGKTSVEGPIEMIDDVNDSIDEDDIDLNASLMIQKNMADLSVIFESEMQPQKIDLELDDIVFEREAQSDDEALSLSGQSSEGNQTNVANEMLSEDDDIFQDIATPKIASTIKKAKRNHEAITDEHDQPTSSTPSTTKPMNKVTLLHPKRLRFDCAQSPATKAEQKPIVFGECGFKTGRGMDVGISSEKLKKTAKIFEEIMADFDGLPMLEQPTDAMPGFSSVAGFKTPHRAAVCSSSIEDPFLHQPSTSNGFINARRADPTLGPSTLSGLKTVRKADGSCPKITEQCKPMPSMSSTSGGFKTARGCQIQRPTDADLRKSIKLFDFEQDNASFDVDPKKQVGWENDFDAPSTSNLNVFSTAVGTSINVSSTTFKKYAALFENEINDNLLNQREVDTSIANAISDDTVAASPVNKSIQAKFITSTPNVEAVKIAKGQSSIEFFEELDDQQCEEFFGEFSSRTQPPQNLQLRRTCLTHRFSQSDTGSEFNPSMVSEHVKSERKEALVRQQANCLRKNNVRPQTGALRKQKLKAKRMPLKKLGKPQSYSRDELTQLGVSANVIMVDVENVAAFKFEMWRYYSKEECMHNVDGIELEDGIKLIMDEHSCSGHNELTSAFLDCDSVDPKLVPDNWIRNSLKWITLKLASLERSFPQRFAGNGLTPANVMLQLKYRYDREIDRSQRSAIRKIVEQDDAASKPLVLFVSRIKNITSLQYSMELCDGWYGIGTGALDPVLTNAVRNRKIRVGTKLLIQDAELIGAEEACSPLEMPSSSALKFSANSTRRAKWHTKLGYFNARHSISFSMKSIEPQGGHICHFKAFIARVYPMLFVAKNQPATNTDNPNTSRTVFRSEKVQRRLEVTENQEKFEVFEALCIEVTAEVEREYRARRREAVAFPKREISEIDDAEELWHLMERSHDEESFETILSATQRTMVSGYREKIQQEKNNEISLRVKEKFDKRGQNSKVTALLKIRIVDCDQPATSRSAVLSVWNADECNFDLRETSFVEITSVSANGLRGKDLLLTANRRTKIQNIETKTMTDAHITIRRKCYQLVDINGDSFKPSFNEFDVVAYVLHIEPIADSNFQIVQFVDSQANILHVKFWQGLKRYAFDDVIEEGKLLAIGNLEWRPMDGRSQHGWPQAFVTDLTTFSANPKSQASIERLRQLTDCFDRMVNKAAYVEECLSLVHARHDFGNETANSTSVLSNSNSSLTNRTLNTSKIENASKSRAKMKINRLKVYKSPPTSPAMPVSNSSISTLRRPFKSPMTTLIPIRTANNYNQENET